MTRTDPALRLLALFERARTHAPGSGEPALKVWPELLGGHQGEPPETLAVVARELRGLRRELGAVDEDGIEHIRAEVDKLTGLFSTNMLLSGWSATEQVLGSDVMMGLKMASATLGRAGMREQTVEQERIDDLKQQVDELTAEVEAAGDLDPVLRAYLLEHLRALTRALALYPIIGSAGLVAELHRALGHEIADRAPVSRSDHPLAKRFGRVIMAVATATSLAQVPIVIDSYQDYFSTPSLPTAVVVGTRPVAEPAAGDGGSMAEPAGDGDFVVGLVRDVGAEAPTAAP